MVEPAGPQVSPQTPIPSHRELFLGMQQVALSSFGGGLSAWSHRAGLPIRILLSCTCKD